jgi:hypothetical protein
MKIAFIGDSFCAQPFFDNGNKSYRAYQYLVAQEYSAKIIAIGRSSGCLFHSYEDLLDVVDKADYTIFCITDLHRLVNRYKLGLNFSSVEQYMITGIDSIWQHHERDEQFMDPMDVYNLNDSFSSGQHISKKLLDNIYNAANNYFEFLWYDDFSLYIHKCILRDIDQLMIEKKKKCIWFPCFENSMQKYVPKSGPIADIVLQKISDAELKKIHPRVRRKAIDHRPNHLSKENNQNRANLIINIIERDAFNAHEIKMKDYFGVE